MIFLIRLIQNAVSIYSIILVAFALLSWFPNAYESQLGRLVIRLARPVIEPLRKLNLQFAGLDFTVCEPPHPASCLFLFFFFV